MHLSATRALMIRKGAVMLNEIIYASLITLFFNVGFIGILQRVMHIADPALEVKNPYLWRTELIYVVYFAIVSLLLLWVGEQTPYDFFQMLLLNCQVLILISLTNALELLRNIVLAIAIGITLFTTLLGMLTPPIIIGNALFIAYLIIEHLYFYPFDEHPWLRLGAKLTTGWLFWLLMLWSDHLPQTLTTVMIISYFIAAVGTFMYMVLLRREHLRFQNAEHNVYHDGLTNARNWLAYRRDIHAVFVDHTHDQRLSLLTFDIDHFKQVNDTYGHTSGNTVLISTVNLIQDYLKQHANGVPLYRTGGEEFIVILPDTTQMQAQTIAADLLEDIRQLDVIVNAQTTLKLTASFGVTTMNVADIADKQLYQRADMALYRAKKNGRNQVFVLN